MERIETTYADLRPTDLVIDKAGNAWPIAELRENFTGQQPASPSFWLCDPVTKVKMHHVVKLSTDAVTVSRVPSHTDEAAKLEADFDVNRNVYVGVVTDEAPPLPDHLRPEHISDSFVTMEEAVANVEAIGGEVEAVVTAEEVDAAAAATDDAPVQLPPFADMTPLEQRSHLYLLHGVLAYDMKSAAELLQMHSQAHAQHDAGTLQSAHIPHTHDGSF